jgi:hypothetical protein
MGVEMLKIYLLTQDINKEKYAFNAAIVIAESEDQARTIYPDPYYRRDDWIDDFWKVNNWCNPSEVKVKLIGIAEQEISSGLILSSVN